MKKIIVLTSAIALCTLATTSCDSKKEVTAKPDLWRRTVEPRLTGAFEWLPCGEPKRRGEEAVANVQCGAPTSPSPVSTSSESCESMMRGDTTNANQVLSAHPGCTDDVIRLLASRAEGNAQVASDLAGAYYVRAQRNDAPVDLLRAADAAEKALALNASLAAAHFNEALALSAMGLLRDAVRALDRFLELEKDQQWRREALGRRNELSARIANDAMVVWPSQRKRIDEAALRGDRQAVRQLIEPYMSATHSYVEDELLPRWASGEAEALNIAGMVAEEIEKINKDPYLPDAVRAITSADGERMTALQKGHQAYGARQFADAARLLESGGSPVSYTAVVKGGSPLLQTPESHAAHQRTASAPRFPHTRSQLLLGNSYQTVNDPIASLKVFDDLLPELQALKDRDMEAGIYARRSAALSVLGQTESAWREAVRAQRGAGSVASPGSRGLFVAEVAASAVALGYPAVACRFRDDLVASLRPLWPLAKNDDKFRNALSVTLHVALRSRASDCMSVGKHAQAQADLREAESMATKEVLSDAQWRILQPRMLETRARVAVESNPAEAVRLLTNAIALEPKDVFITHRAGLYVQRAEAHRRMQNLDAAARDFATALEEIRQEEAEVTRRRLRGDKEVDLNPYFSRFRDVYEQLIAHYIEGGDYETAFNYAERSRAYEPLTRVSGGRSTPEAFRAMAGEQEQLDLRRVQGALGPDTSLIHYFVRENETYVWAVSRGRFDFLALGVKARELEMLVDGLHTAAAREQEDRFDATLLQISLRVLPEPLMRLVRGRRIVFVADGALHGVPFSALRDVKTREHLIESSVVSAAPSATLYIHSLLRDRELPTVESPSALLVADPRLNPDSPFHRGLPELLLAEREVGLIRRHYGPATEILRDAEATVPAFLARAREHPIVHFAGHARPSPEAPLQSMLLFAESDGHNGVLTAEELLAKVRLDRTRLVVLSACSSAEGSTAGAAGVAPLVRPLIAAGVPAVVGALWPVRDDDAMNVAVRFHEHYMLGMDAATALRKAQLQLLESGGRHPVLAWAPFQVIGHASSPKASAKSNQTQRSD